MVGREYGCTTRQLSMEPASPAGSGPIYLGSDFFFSDGPNFRRDAFTLKVNRILPMPVELPKPRRKRPTSPSRFSRPLAAIAFGLAVLVLAVGVVSTVAGPGAAWASVVAVVRR